MTPPAAANTQIPKRQSATRSPLLSVALGLAVLAAAVLPYLRTLDFDFVWDDHYTVGTHLSIHGWSDVERLW